MTRFLPVACAALVVASCGPAATSHDPFPEPGAKRVRARTELRDIAAKEVADDGKATVVMLSVGADDGVEVGYRFTVYRGDEYVGKVEVIKVLDDMSYARVLTDWKRGEIRENDDASTRVY